MGCGDSKPKGAKATPKGGDAAAAAAPKVKANIEVYGVTVSMNCLGTIMLATQEGLGKVVPTMPSQTAGEGTMAPEFLKINPFHGVPAIKDGDTCLAESNAVLRYLSGKYAEKLYVGLEKQRRAHIDWAMDKFASSLYTDVLACLYPLAGFREAPADQAAAGKKASDNLQKFADVFLTEKFIGGKELSIADYKVAPFFFAYSHPKAQEISKVELPERIKQFNFDFKAACPEGAKVLAEGEMSIKGFLDKKHSSEKPMFEVKEGFKEANLAQEAAASVMDFLSNLTTGGKGDVKVYGVTVSMNVMGPVVLQKHCGIGSMEVCMPGEQSQSEEYRKMFPYGGVPGLKDGKWCMSESNAILRYMAREYAEELYPKDPAKRGHIDWAMDRFNFGMYNDCVSTIYVAMGFAAAPEKEEDLKSAGKKASDGLKEFVDFFLKEPANKFVGGSVLSIADFKIAPFFAAYAHQRVKDKCFVEVPERIVKFNKDFLAACPSAEILSKAEGGVSICEFLDSKTAAEQGGGEPASAEDIALQKAMEVEAVKEVVPLANAGPTIDNTSAPMCGCFS